MLMSYHNYFFFFFTNLPRFIFFEGLGVIVLGAISLGRVVVTSPKIVKNIPKTYEYIYLVRKIISVHRLNDSTVHTDRQTNILLLIYEDMNRITRTKITKLNLKGI